MSSSVLYTGIVVLVTLERGVELVLSNRNSRRAMARGAVEVGTAHYRWMVLIHTSFLLSCLLEVWLFQRPFLPLLALLMGLLLTATMGLRYWCIATLGERWNTRVICLPDCAAVQDGPYRFIRHPNYVAVTLEIVALPMIHTAWVTALVFSMANLVILSVRIRVEEETLRTHADYDRTLGRRPRFLPR